MPRPCAPWATSAVGGARRRPRARRPPGRLRPCAGGGRSASVAVVDDEGLDVVLGELLAAAEEAELDQEAEAGDLAAEPLDQVAQRARRAARCQEVVVDQHPLT